MTAIKNTFTKIRRLFWRTANGWLQMKTCETCQFFQSYSTVDLVAGQIVGGACHVDPPEYRRRQVG